jgi:hypothetical protein
MLHMSPEEMKEIATAELTRRSQSFCAAVSEGRGDAILDFVRLHWFGDKTPFTAVNGTTDEWRTVFNLGLQKAFLDLTRFVEAAKLEPASRPTHAVSALSGSGDTN